MTHSLNYPERDAELDLRLETILGARRRSLPDVLRSWPAYVQRRTLPRFLAHYELFRQTVDLPGCIVELGVFHGASFFTWSNLLETFNTNDRSKKVYGFDHFEGLRPDHFQDDKDGLRDGRDQKQDWAYRASAEELRALTALHNDDNLLPGVERCVLVEGDVFESVPRFLRENPGLRIALLYCDLDLYGPTKFCLEHFYPLVVNGGIVCFDEYGLIPWEGESRAVDEFLAEHRLSPRLRRFPFSPSPCGYFVKGENPEPAHPGMPRR